MELTEQQKQHICAGLARAMGWDFIASSSEIALPGDGEWYTPFGRAYGNEPPDPFTDAAASRALVEWIAGSSTPIKRAFLTALSQPLSDACCFTDAPLDEDMILTAMIAPLEAIALAAWQAIQEK